MVLKLHSAPYGSGGNGLAALVLAEKRVPFQFVEVETAKKQHKTPEFLAMHPFGQVPVIDDDGFTLYESRAICRYIAEKYYPHQGTRLVPSGLEAKALFEQAASVEFANFYPAMMKVAMEALGKQRRGLPVDQAVLDADLVEFSATFDAILSKQKYVAGNDLTLVDLFHLSGLSTASIRPRSGRRTWCREFSPTDSP
ncbi:thioredoxin-like protein [Mycena pura]|uniref:glutathione transferase n=1 Tax=Mycena pura TaxID=153505 RepID=A0AAD6UPN0_9AGAR|nr:thioredoxin-like protein [Mycena pura]